MNSAMKLYRIIGDIESKGFLLSVGSIIYPKMKPTNNQVEKQWYEVGFEYLKPHHC